MRASTFKKNVLAFGFGVLLLSGAAPAEKPQEPAKAMNLQRGQTRDEVLKQFGPPRRIARQILYQRHLEQWIYDRPQHLRLEFNCPRGKEGQLTAVLPILP